MPICALSYVYVHSPNLDEHLEFNLSKLFLIKKNKNVAALLTKDPKDKQEISTTKVCTGVANL